MCYDLIGFFELIIPKKKEKKEIGYTQLLVCGVELQKGELRFFIQWQHVDDPIETGEHGDDGVSVVPLPVSPIYDQLAT